MKNSLYLTLNRSIKTHYFIVALLFMVSPVFLFSQEDKSNNITSEKTTPVIPASKPKKNSNFIAIGAEYSYSQSTEYLYSQNITKTNPPFHSAGGFIEIENNFTRYFSLLSTFAVNYMMEEQPYLNLSYLFGSRIYLVPRYFYIDSGIEFIYSHALDDFFEVSTGLAFNIAVGANIPFSETTSIQIKAFSREILGHFHEKGYKNYSSYGFVSAVQFKI